MFWLPVIWADGRYVAGRVWNISYRGRDLAVMLTWVETRDTETINNGRKQYGPPSLSLLLHTKFCRQRKPQRGFQHFLSRMKTLGELILKTGGHGIIFYPKYCSFCPAGLEVEPGAVWCYCRYEAMGCTERVCESFELSGYHWYNRLWTASIITRHSYSQSSREIKQNNRILLPCDF